MENVSKEHSSMFQDVSKEHGRMFLEHGRMFLKNIAECF